MSNNPPSDQLRNLSTTSPAGGYSSAPGQLGLPPDMAYPNAYTYAQSPHDPTGGYPFASPTSYRPSLQTHSLGPSQQMQGHPQQHSQQQSPTSNRNKRRASDLGELGQGVSAVGTNAHPYGSPPILGGVRTGDMEMGVGPAQTVPATVKKGRTNTPWTPAEEQRLKALRDAGSSWSEIAKTFPTRTEGSVKKHWYKDMHYAEFAEDEAIKDYDNNKWKVIGQKVGKPAKACEQFAKEQGWKV